MRETPQSEKRHRSDGLRVAAVSAGFVLLGVVLRDRVPWYATAFFVVCLAVGVLMALGWRPKELPPAEHLTIDDAGITRSAKGLREHVAWGDVVRVRIMTTDEGPWGEDVFFILEGRSGAGCVVPHDLAVRGQLLEALQSRLEGMNNAAVIESMLSIENRMFTVWEEKSPP
jgi:hypothetical protein